jgi:uncharacterized alkaline shock family protein YloU
MIIVKENYMGKVGISERYIKTLCGQILTECIGVSGLLPAGRRWGLGWLIHGEGNPVKHADRAVTIKVIDGKLIIGVHIAVIYGSQVTAISESVVGKLKWAIEERTSIPVQKITVYVDEMTA